MKNKQGVRNPPSKDEGLTALNKYLEINNVEIDKDTLRTFARDKDQMEWIINNQQ